MRILKLSDTERKNARSLLARSTNTVITDLFDSLPRITEDFKKEFKKCKCAFSIVREDAEVEYSEFNYDEIDSLIANMLFESFFTLRASNEFVADVGFGNVQTCYHLINCNNADENYTVKLTPADNLIVLASNGVLRLLTQEEFMPLDNEDMKKFFDEDQKI